MMKSKTQASLLEASKSNEKINDSPTFSPKRHTNSVTSQRSMELLNIIKNRSDDLLVKNQFQSDEKFQTAEEEIDELKKENNKA